LGALRERLMEQPIVSLALDGIAHDQELTTVAGMFCGWSLWENGGVNATVMVLRDGSTDAGNVLAIVQIPAGRSDASGPSPEGPIFSVGLRLQMAVGNAAGAVWVRMAS
jgi:hypothetical protein